MNGLNIYTVIPGRNSIPGIYSANFDPTAYPDLPMLTRLAIGAIVIQNANFDPNTCTEVCALALWIKTCPSDCATSTWQPIPLGNIVIPPDVHCVAGSLTAGNILVLNLNDGSQIQVDLSALASDKFIASAALGAGNVLTLTMNDGSTVTVDLSALAAVAPVAVDGVTVVGDGVGTPLKAGNLVDNGNGSYTWTSATGATFTLPAPRQASFGVSPLVINPTNGANNWASGASESTPITTLTIPAATYPRIVEAHVLHGVLARMTTFESPKANALSFQSLVSFDKGDGVLQLASLAGNYMGVNQLIAQAVATDLGQNAGAAGNEPLMTGVCYIPLAAGASITLRAQSTLTIQDGANTSLAWTFCQLAATVLPA